MIEFPAGQKMLIDAGPEASWPMLRDYLQKQGVKRLDWVLFTHPHEDHIGGGAKLIESFEIGKIYMAKTTYTTSTYENLLKAADEKGLKFTLARAGMRIGPGSDTSDPKSGASTQGQRKQDITMKIIGPVGSYSDVNESSLVVSLTYGDTTFLFMGDAGAESEKDMLEANVIPHAEVLKVGHHGSDTSTTSAFLNQVNPSIAVIPVGKNNEYHLPSSSVLKKLKSRSIQVYRLDVYGDLVVTVKDGKLEVTPENP